MLLFSDNHNILHTVKFLDDADLIHSDLNEVIKWCDHNNLPLNVNKCKTMSFNRFRSNLSIYHFIYIATA